MRTLLSVLLVPAAALAAPQPPSGIAVVKIRVVKSTLLPENGPPAECCVVDSAHWRISYQIDHVYAGKPGRRGWSIDYQGPSRHPGVSFFAVVRDGKDAAPEILASAYAPGGACFTPAEISAFGIKPAVEQLRRAYPCRSKLVLAQDGTQYFEPND